MKKEKKNTMNGKQSGLSNLFGVFKNLAEKMLIFLLLIKILLWTAWEKLLYKNRSKRKSYHKQQQKPPH